MELPGRSERGGAQTEETDGRRGGGQITVVAPKGSSQEKKTMELLRCFTLSLSEYLVFIQCELQIEFIISVCLVCHLVSFPTFGVMFVFLLSFFYLLSLCCVFTNKYNFKFISSGVQHEVFFPSELAEVENEEASAAPLLVEETKKVVTVEENEEESTVTSATTVGTVAYTTAEGLHEEAESPNTAEEVEEEDDDAKVEAGGKEKDEDEDTKAKRLLASWESEVRTSKFD